MENKIVRIRRQLGVWRTLAVILIVLSISLIVAVILLALRSGSQSKSPTCGTNSAKNKNTIDLSEPDKPGPFHDLTKYEMVKLREFLEKDPNILIKSADTANIDESTLYMLDLYPAKKADVISYLEDRGPQPDRQARAMVFRGDKDPPVVEEYLCGPLPNVKKCTLMKSGKRRNPVEFSLRPISLVENDAMVNILLKQIHDKAGYILQESYGVSFFDCPPGECLTMYTTPLGTNLVGSITKRRAWVWAVYSVEYYALHPLDFAALVNLDGSDPTKFSLGKVWYHGNMYDSLDNLIVSYNSSKIEKTRIKKRTNTKDAFSSLNQRDPLVPDQPLRPPTLVEPDGRRYSMRDRKVDCFLCNI